MLPSVRYKCRFVVTWSVLLLLQQFQLVLLLNINTIGGNETVREKRGFSKTTRQNIKSSKKATLKSSSALKQRLNVISRVAPKLKNASKHLPENVMVSFKKAIYNSKVKPNRHLKQIAKPANKLKNASKHLPENVMVSFKKAIYNSKVKPNRHLKQTAKPANKLMRCRRMINGVCSYPNYKGTTDLPNKWKDQFDELFNEISNKTKGFDIKSIKQWAVAGVRQSDIYVHSYYSTIAENREKKKKPIPKDKSKIPDKIDNIETDVMHTEQDLLSTIDMENALKNCHNAKPCEVFLYTIRSPCLQHPQPYVESCLNYTVSMCEKWFLDNGTRCHVGFGMFYDNNKDKSFNRKFTSKKDELISDQTTMGFSEEPIRNTDELLMENVEKIRENLVDRMAKKGYETLIKNIKFDFSDAYNNTLKYLKDEKPNMKDLVEKFKQELSTIDIDTTVKDLGRWFEDLIETWNSKYPDETLNVENLDKKREKGYAELKGNVKVEFDHAFNTSLQYLKNVKTLKTDTLVYKFKNDLSKIPKTVEELGARFEKLIDDWIAKYSHETLNKVEKRRTVMSAITEVTKGIQKEVIDFSFYDLS